MSNKVTKAIDRKTLNIFVRLTRKKAKEEIKKAQKNLNRKITKEEKNLIAKRVARRTRGRAAIVSMFGLGILAGYKYDNLLNEGNSKGIIQNETEIVIDSEETNKDVTINNAKSDKEIFVNGIKVELDEIDHNEELQENTQIEIDNLNNSEEVLNYVKEIYVTKYNEENNANITVDDVTFHKGGGETISLYIDEAENGDEIVRTCSGKYYGDNHQLSSEISVVTAIVKDGENIIREMMTYKNGEYVPVYLESEEVEENKENTLTQLKGVTFNGIDYYGAFVDSEKDIYKERFINSVVEYKQYKINEIVKGNSSDEIEKQSSEGFELGD